MEKLETALGVVQPKPEKHANHNIEKDAAGLAKD
jgi:hypothetical protein